MSSLRQQVLVRPGTSVHLTRLDPANLLGLADGKRRGRARAARAVERIAQLQEMLWAEGTRSLLVVLQGTDASGKDGATQRLLTGLNPQGVRVRSFRAPTEAELARDFLWRIHRDVPERGCIGLFNRSHYEDIVTTQVLGLIDAREAERRCHAVNEFERHLHDQGTRLVKCFLHISKEEQRQRLQDRLDQPEKHWKVDLHDLETRRDWDEIHRLYDRAIASTSTEYAPWHVIPADRKWLRDVVLAELVQGALEEMDPKFPPPNPDYAGMTVQ